MTVLEAKLITSKKDVEAKECWDEIGKVILGRGHAVSRDSISYREGMTVDDILALANAKVTQERKS